jgi:predicted RNA polymerase sigma factor
VENSYSLQIRRETNGTALINEGQKIVRACTRRDSAGTFQLQAVHCNAATFEDTDWAQIVTLYDQLNPIVLRAVVALSRAIAIGETEGPEAALPKPDQDDLTKDRVESLIGNLIAEVRSLLADNDLASQDKIAQ